MSEYPCFNCGELNHCTADLVRVEWRGKVSLLCRRCIDKIFVEDEEKQEEKK
jgi:hypothetical protein